MLIAQPAPILTPHSTVAQGAFERVTETIFASIRSGMTNEYEARLRARVIARSNLKAQLYGEHPELRPTDAPPPSPSSDEE